MISFLEGEVVDKSVGRVVLNVAGVGYELVVPTSLLAALPGTGELARVHTRLVVREDSMTLFGFASPDERELFDLLTGVTGVGPKVALAFLSSLRPEVLRRAVTIVPGVGKKVAQRVVLDLRDKLGGEGAEIIAIGPMADVRDALLALGLTPPEASQVLADLDPDGKEPDDLLREALQKVGR
jgi:Holliday junction DNA helicase RuvA